MALPWFRLYHEARNDAKLRHLTDAQFRVWFNLLCLASEQPDRGTIASMNVKLMALEVAGGDVDLLKETLETLETFHCVSLRFISVSEASICFINFQKRQFQGVSGNGKTSTDRVRKHREAKRLRQHETGETSETPVKRDETLVKRDETPPDTESEAETESLAPRARETTAPTGGMICVDEPEDFGDSGLGLPPFPADGGYALDGPEYPFKPPVEQVRAIYDELWRAFGHRRLCADYLRNRGRYDSRAWRWAIQRCQTKGLRPRSLGYLGKIASDWQPGDEPALPRPAPAPVKVHEPIPQREPLTPSQKARYAPLPGHRLVDPDAGIPIAERMAKLAPNHPLRKAWEAGHGPVAVAREAQ
jgi:hypothetical protein